MNEKKYYFYSQTAKLIMSARVQKKKQVEISLDLNKTTTVCNIAEDKLIIDDDIHVEIESLQGIAAKENKVFILKDSNFEPIEYRGDDYYKLVPTDSAPTFEISGIRMHRTKEYDPFINAKEIAREVIRKGHRVLDTCGGLGEYFWFSERK